MDVNSLSDLIQSSLIIDLTFLVQTEDAGPYRVEVKKCLLWTWKLELNSFRNSKIFYSPSSNSQSKEINILEASSSPLIFVGNDGESFNTKTSMVFEVVCEGEAQVQSEIHVPEAELIQSFKTGLTKTGERQLRGLKNLLLNIPSILRDNRIYAPYMPLIQSSGYGKSKITAELLKVIPGVSMVFRDSSDRGFPQQASWVMKLRSYVYAAKEDIFPIDEDSFLTSKATDYSSGRFLMALFKVIQSYFRQFSRIYASNCRNRDQTIKSIGEYFLSNPSDWLEELNFEANDPITMNSLLFCISRLFKASNDAASEDLSIFVGFTKETVRIAMPAAQNLQFLILMDELACFDASAAPGRLTGVHVVRRALHLLESPRLFVVAIGTNSDSWDFSPAVRDNSLRYRQRKNLLSPIWLSGNGDIFFNELQLHAIEFGKTLLLNRNYMKVLLSMGRALWSSLKIEDALSTAIDKMQNGNNHSKESLMSYLLCRAGMGVSPSSVLSRTLVRSHMATVHFIDADGRSMKISYPSEPLLAFAARHLLRSATMRSNAFEALAAFTQRQAIDRGRLVETIHEHMVLFAIDDSPPCNSEYHLDNSLYHSSNLRKILNCDSFLLSIDFTDSNEQPNVEMEQDGNLVTSESYHVIKVSSFLEKIFGQSNFDKFSEFLGNCPELENGYINASHFINFEESSAIYKYFREKKQKFKIDRSLLKLLLMRSCALVFPSNQYGLDFIVPVLLSTSENQRPVYSYIGFQSKASMKFDQYEAVAKSNIQFSLKKCSETGNCYSSSNYCQGGSACYTDFEYDLISKEQLVIIMSLDHSDMKKTVEQMTVHTEDFTGKRSRNSSTGSQAGPTSIASAAIESTMSSTTASSRQYLQHLKMAVIQRAQSIWPASICRNASYRCVRKYPKLGSFSKDRPSLIIKKTFPSEFGTENPISVHKMVWDSANGRPKQSLTCIISHDVINHQHLLDGIRSCRTIKNMVNDRTTIFTDIPDLHLDFVVDSYVNGPCSPFNQFNPHLRAARGIAPLASPLENMSNYTSGAMRAAIGRCINRNSGDGEPL